MALKKNILYTTLLLFSFSLTSISAQEQNIIIADEENIDSTLVDTAKIDTAGLELEEIKPDTVSWKIKSLPQVEDMVRSLQDSFLYANRDFFTNTFYRSENNFYTLSNSQSDYYLEKTRINCLVWNDFNVLPLINFFPYTKQGRDIKFTNLDLNFQAPFTSVTYKSGAHRKESKSFYLVKNNFLATVKGSGRGIADIQIALNSGSEESSWGKKNYFDNLALGVSRDFGNFDLKYNFIKSFYERQRVLTHASHIMKKIKNFNPYTVTFRNSYYINLLSANIWEDYLSISYMNQLLDNHVNIQNNDTKYQNFNFNRNQITLTGYLPIKNYHTNIILYADDFDFDSHNNYTEFYGFLQFDTPGFWSEFYDLTISNSFTYNTLVDSFTSESEISFHLPITENLKTNLKVGVEKEQIPLFYDYVLACSKYILECHKSDYVQRDIVYYNFDVQWESPNLRFKLTPFVRDITNDKNIDLLEVDEYRSYGVDFRGEYKFIVLNIENNFNSKVSYSQPEKDFAFRPKLSGKLGWEMQRSLKHNNFVFLNGYLNFFGLYDDKSGVKQSRQLFFSGEFGFKINRFNISVNFNNIFDNKYFLFKENKINGFSTGIKLNWSFIN